LDNAMKRLRINELQSFDPDLLPRNLLKVYSIWRQGIDLKTIYSTGTIYNYASKLRDYNIDIYQAPEESNVINLARSLESRTLTVEDCDLMGLPVWRPTAA